MDSIKQRLEELEQKERLWRKQFQDYGRRMKLDFEQKAAKIENDYTEAVKKLELEFSARKKAVLNLYSGKDDREKSAAESDSCHGNAQSQFACPSVRSITVDSNIHSASLQTTLSPQFSNDISSVEDSRKLYTLKIVPFLELRSEYIEEERIVLGEEQFIMEHSRESSFTLTEIVKRPNYGVTEKQVEETKCISIDVIWNKNNAEMWSRECQGKNNNNDVAKYYLLNVRIDDWVDVQRCVAVYKVGSVDHICRKTNVFTFDPGGRVQTSTLLTLLV